MCGAVALRGEEWCKGQESEWAAGRKKFPHYGPNGQFPRRFPAVSFFMPFHEHFTDTQQHFYRLSTKGAQTPTAPRAGLENTVARGRRPTWAGDARVAKAEKAAGAAFHDEQQLSQ
jgi:hypothetical protein